MLTITPFESQVVFSKTDFVYDGKEKCPSAYYTDILGRKVPLSVSGGRSLAGGRTMSMFNEETICMDCADKERERPDYKAACDAEIAAVRAGNRNFKGIGL